MQVPGDELIDRIYGAAVEPESWRDVVRDICRAFDAHSGVFAFSDNHVELSSVSVSHGVFEDASTVAKYFSYYSGIDMAVPAFATHQTGKFTTTARLFAPAVLATNEFYNDFFLKLGLIDTMGGNMLRDERGTAMICLQREDGTPAFADDDISAMERLAPHLRRALQVHRLFAPARRAAAAFSAALDRLTAGAVLLDERGRVWHCNNIAREIFDRRDGLYLSTVLGMTAADRSANGRLARFVGAVLAQDDDAAGGQVAVPRAEGRASYTVLVAPVRSRMLSPFDLSAPRGALLLISDPDRAPNSNLAVAMARYRLTRAELALLGGLVEGKSLTDYRKEAGISINTTKFHLRSLFAKTETHSQVGLVRLALIALRGL